MGFILRKVEEEEKKNKEDQNLLKVKNLNNYDVVYLPMKQNDYEKENLDLEKLLSEYNFYFINVFQNLFSVNNSESLKVAITSFTTMITQKKKVFPQNYHKLAKLSLKLKK